MQHRLVPRYIQELQHVLHPRAGVQDQLLVRHAETPLGPQLPALVVHGFDGAVPLLQTLSVTGQVEAGDCHFPGYDRVSRGPAVTHHKNELGIGKEIDHVSTHFNGEGVFVAETGGGFAVFGDYF